MQRVQEPYGMRSQSRYRAAWQCLADLQFSPDSLGTQYLSMALELVSRRPELGRNLNRHLYPYLAGLHASTTIRVERDIRYAIESAWSRCRPEVAERYFGYTTHPDKGKPTNREFIMTVALYIRDRA